MDGIRHLGTPIGHASCEQCGMGSNSVICLENAVPMLQSGNMTIPDHDAEASGLPAHPGKELLSGNAIREACMIMRTGNHRCAALAAVDYGVGARFVQNCTLSCSGCERSTNAIECSEG
jgi:hypothetical protein